MQSFAARKCDVALASPQSIEDIKLLVSQGTSKWIKVKYLVRVDYYFASRNEPRSHRHSKRFIVEQKVERTKFYSNGSYDNNRWSTSEIVEDHLIEITPNYSDRSMGWSNIKRVEGVILSDNNAKPQSRVKERIISPDYSYQISEFIMHDDVPQP